MNRSVTDQWFQVATTSVGRAGSRESGLVTVPRHSDFDMLNPKSQ
jgi:hypothetical protein